MKKNKIIKELKTLKDDTKYVMFLSYSDQFFRPIKYELGKKIKKYIDDMGVEQYSKISKNILFVPFKALNEREKALVYYYLYVH